MTISTRSLFEEERQLLFEFLDSDSFVAKRAQLLLLSTEDLSPPKIQSLVDLHVKTVRKWIKRFNTEGFPRLLKKGGSRPLTFAPAVRKRIVEVALTQPEELAFPFSTWSLYSLRTYLIQEKVSGDICPETLRTIFVEVGLRWRPHKTWLWISDPHYEVKKQQVLALYKTPTEDVMVLYVDEKGSIAAKTYGGRNWAAKKEVVARNQKIKGKVMLFGAYNPHTKELLGRTAERKDAEAFLAFLAAFEKEISGKKQVILDNCSADHAKKVKEWLNAHPTLELVFLPTSSPHLNRIEQVFGDLQRECLNNRSFEAPDKVEAALTTYIAYFNTQRRALLKGATNYKLKRNTYF
ncbi:MAG: IS630 family transposase [Candidatus Heimdallarchaeota archaeon]